MPALAALAAIPTSLVVGFALVLLLFAYYTLVQKPLASLFDKLPVVGGYVADTVSRSIGGLVTWVVNRAKDGLGQINAWLTRLPALVYYGFVNVNSALQAAVNYTAKVATAAANGVGYVGDRVTTALGRVAAVAAELASLGGTVQHLADRIAKVISSTIPAAIATAEAYVRTRVAAAVDAVMSTVHQLNNGIRSWAAQAIDSATVTLGHAIDGVRSQLGATIHQLGLAIDAQVAQLTHAIDGLGLRLDGRIDGLVRTLAPILALELTRVIPALRTRVDTMDRECVTPTCNALRPNLDALGALNDGLMMAAILGLAAEAYHDPEGMAQATVGFTNGVASAAETILGDVAGFHV